MQTRKVRKAVIPAAGRGTRFMPITKSVPKEMLVLVDKPAIHYIVEECAEELFSAYNDEIMGTVKRAGILVVVWVVVVPIFVLPATLIYASYLLS